MLHTKFEASEQSGSEEEIFEYFSYIVKRFETRAPSAGPSWTQGPFSEQTW